MVCSFCGGGAMGSGDGLQVQAMGSGDGLQVQAMGSGDGMRWDLLGILYGLGLS